jgi:hypothetical protein
MNMKITVVAASLALAAATPAHADETYTYLCEVGHKSFPVTVNVDRATLVWRGTTYTDLKETGGAVSNAMQRITAAR